MDKKFWISIGVSVIFIGTTLFFNWYFLSDIDINEKGAYGDLYGFSNTLFSGLAFVGVIAAIIIQSKELKLQRDELRDTRAEFEQQNSTLRKQAFENTFFELQSQKRNALNSMNIQKYTFEGPAVIINESYELRKKINNIALPDDSISEIKKKLIDNSDFVNHTTSLYNELSNWVKCHINSQFLIKTTPLISNREKAFYEQLVFNQLSESELFFIYLVRLLEIPKDKNVVTLLIRKTLFLKVNKKILFQPYSLTITSFGK